MTEITMKDYFFLPYSAAEWGAAHLERLVEICLELDCATVFDDINDLLTIYWQHRKFSKEEQDKWETLIQKVDFDIRCYGYEWNGITNHKTRKKLLSCLENDIEKNKLDYSDNYRFAIKGNKDSERGYKAQLKRGCCGYWDQEVVVGKVTYLYGCNYGH